MVDNCFYDHVKLLHELSCLSWFLEKHGIPGAQEHKHAQCLTSYKELRADLEKHIERLKKSLCSE